MPLNSLGFDKDPSQTRVVVAMSGGVDSSVVAALLHEEGYDVIGVTLQLYDHGAMLEKKGACCAGKDIYDAKKIASEKGFPHYVLNYESNFQQSVMDDFADSYLKGETPIPCVRCNQTVKFRDLLDVARDLGADCMATGHYIQRSVDEQGMASLHRGLDMTKDQSYFLFATTQDQLDFLRFPLGAWDKSQTREHALRLGLVNADKPDSQDICFVPDGDYAKVVRKMRPEGDTPGNIIDLKGNVLGQHKGIIDYTIGQRRGLGIGGGHTMGNAPLYVVGIDAKDHTVIVGPKEALSRDLIMIEDCNWLQGSPAQLADEEELEIEVKLRSVSKPYKAYLSAVDIKSKRAVIRLEAPQYGISPGQAAVCYDGDRVLGGGWIYGTENTKFFTGPVSHEAAE